MHAVAEVTVLNPRMQMPPRSGASDIRRVYPSGGRLMRSNYTAIRRHSASAVDGTTVMCPQQNAKKLGMRRM